VTLELVALAALIFVPLALVTGIAAGLRQGSRLDRLLQGFGSVSISAPSFFVGLVLIMIFAVQLKWVPPFGYVKITDDVGDWFKTMILPATALSFSAAAVLSRQLRSSLGDVMESPYIQAAWAKGGTSKQVVGGYGLKNAAIAPVTILGLQLAALIGGSAIIEQIFNLPGIGTYLLSAIVSHDLPVVQGVTLVYVIVFALMNLAVDISYGFLNPKVRVQ
jgi:peptide/nickel transport system permease protein